MKKVIAQIASFRQTIFSLLLLSFLLVACGGGGGDGSGTTRVGLSIRIPASVEKVSASGRGKAFAPAPAPIAAIGVSVVDAGGVQLASTRLTVSPGEDVTVTLEVPAGRARTFTVQALDATGNVLFQGQTSADLTAGVPSSLSIQMSPVFVIQASLTLSPPSASVRPGGTVTFTATPTGLTDPTLNWSVNDIVGGNATVGTITPTGPTTAVYTAPNNPPTPNPVTIKVASASNPTLSATAAVTVLPPATLSLSPTIRSLLPGQTQRFTVTITGLDDPTLVWTVNDVKDGNATVGTITQDNPALYTAPNTVPTPNSVTIKATSASNPALFATATVTLLTPSTTVSINSETGADGPDCGSVDAPCKTITQGLALAKAGQTLLVAPGTYTFNSTGGGETAPLTMKQGVNIQGSGSETTVLIFNSTNDPDRAGIIGADNATFSNFTVEGNEGLDSDMSLTVGSTTVSDNVFISLCNLCTSGVRVRGSGGPTLVNNTFGKSGAGLDIGLRVEDTAAPLVSNNTFSGNRIGIQVLANATPDLGGGAKQSTGGNTLSCNQDFDLDTAVGVAAQGNLWDHVPPKLGDIAGQGIDLTSSKVSTFNAQLAGNRCSVSITSPAPSALVRGTITITANVGDPTGVSEVDFFISTASGPASIGTSPAAPYQTTRDTTLDKDGPHSLSATLKNANGTVTDADSLSVTVDNTPPSVRITAPTPDAGPLGCGNVTVTALASDPNGVSQVEFFVSQQSIGLGTPGTNGNFSRSWAPSANGSYTLTAAATDQAGNKSPQSAGITVQVSCVTSIQVSPSPAVVAKDKTQSFTLALKPPSATNADVSWRVNGIVGGRSDLGTISSDGLYTPPAKIPTNPSEVATGVTVEAVSRTDSNVIGTSAVTLVTGSKLAFDPNVPVTQKTSTVSTDSSGQRSIAFFNGTIEVVWDNGSTILFSESTDGKTWSAPVTVASGNVGQPTLAMGPDGSVYVAYQSIPVNNVALIRSIQLAVRPPGKVFGPLTGLTNVGSSAQDPTLTVSPKDGTLFVAWADIAPNGTTGYDIYLQRIGIDKTARKINTDTTDAAQTQPVLAAGKNGEIYLAWNDQARVMATASFDSGANFLQAVQVSASGTIAANPTLAVAPNGALYFAWQDRTTNQFLIFFNLADSSKGVLNLKSDASHAIGTANTGVLQQQAPSIASDDQGEIYIALAELFGDDTQILLAKSTDNGKTFVFSPIDDDTKIVQNKSAPSLAVDGVGRAFAIWTDGRNDPNATGVNDVFFSRGE